MSRIVAGKLSLDIRELNPGAAIQAAIEAVRPLAEAKSIQIDSYFSSNVGTIMADPLRLQQVFWNLLTNAVKFSAPESKVSVRMERVADQQGEKAMAEIKVSDSGKGIDAAFLPQIFDRFSQEDSSSIRLHGGLGLGLAIVRNLVELHGGTIRAESLGDKLGATFTVAFPIKSDQGLAEPQVTHIDSLKGSIKTRRVPVKLEGIRVLIVDDDVNAREAIGVLLRSFGAEIKAAAIR